MILRTGISTRHTQRDGRSETMGDRRQRNTVPRGSIPEVVNDERCKSCWKVIVSLRDNVCYY